jgi:hypothetical protein
MLHSVIRSAVIGALLVLVILISGRHAESTPIQTVFVVAMENHNWTQPANQFTGNIQQVFQNPNAPFINSLVNGTANAVINGSPTNISSQVAYASNYHSVLATPSGNNLHIHPSEPNYIWAEAGTNFGVLNDNDPFRVPGGTNQNTHFHLSNFLTLAGKTWKSYQEDIDLTTVSGKLTNTVLPQSQWTAPITSFAGTFSSGVNAFNGTGQFDYAAKHNPQVFFTDTNGGNNGTPSNPLSQNYAPLQQLLNDLQSNTVAQYNWITPDQFNDMHTTLAGGYVPLGGGAALTGDPGRIRQGDDFLKQLVPIIMASPAYQNNGAIVLWWDESEGDGVAGDNADDFNHTIGEIVISPDAHPNINGLPYASPLNYTHSSDLRTMQEIFNVGPYLGDAANALDLSDLFVAGAIPNGFSFIAAVPEPPLLFAFSLGLGAVAFIRRRHSKSGFDLFRPWG